MILIQEYRNEQGEKRNICCESVVKQIVNFLQFFFEGLDTSYYTVGGHHLLEFTP